MAKKMAGSSSSRNPEGNGLNNSATKPEMCQFEVRLGDFVREGLLTAQMASNKTQVGELVVELKRCPEQNRYPTVSSASRRHSNNVIRRPSARSDESYLNDLDGSDLSVPTEKFRISAKDQMRFLVNDFSKRCRLRKSEVKAELLAFKRAVLRDYSNRLMKFSMSFDNLTNRQAARNVNRNNHLNGAVNNGVSNGYLHRPDDTRRAPGSGTLPKVSGVQSVDETAAARTPNQVSPRSRTVPAPSAHAAHPSLASLSASGVAAQTNAVPSATKAPGLPISSAAHSQLMDQFISLSPPIQSTTGGVRLGVARKTLKRPLNALSFDPMALQQPASCNGYSALPMTRPVIVQKRPVVSRTAATRFAVLGAQLSRTAPTTSSVNAVVNRLSTSSQILAEPSEPVSSVRSANELQSSSRAASGIPQIVSVTTLANPLEVGPNVDSDVAGNRVETESEISSCSTIMAGSITGTIPNPSINLSNSSVSSTGTGTTIAAAEESRSNVATNISTNTPDSAIDVEMSGEDEQASSRKRVKQEPIFEPSEEAASLEPNLTAPPIFTCNSATASAVVPPPEESVEQVSNVVASGVVQPTQEKPFKCWICDFRFTEEAEIDLHLRTNYQNASDSSHTPASITPLFNLDNPKILIFCESGAILLKCLLCDQIHKKLSQFLIHNMMHCPDNANRTPVRHQPPNSNRITVFDVIKTVDSNDLPAIEERMILAGSNEISICGRIECGALLNKFDLRPHRRCLNSSSSDPTRIKCKFANCSFEGDKKNLITHYTMSHLILLSNVNLQREECEFLDVHRNANVSRLIHPPSPGIQNNHRGGMQNAVVQHSQFPNRTTTSNNAASMGYHSDTILQGTVPPATNISGNNPNVASNRMPPGAQQVNSHIHPSMAQHTSVTQQQPRVTNYNQFYVSNTQPNQCDGNANVAYYQPPQQNMYVQQQPSYVQQQQPQAMNVLQQRFVYQNRTATHPQQRTPFQAGGPFRSFRPLVSTQQPTQHIQQPTQHLQQPTQHMQHSRPPPAQTQPIRQSYGHSQVQSSNQSIQQPSNSSSFAYLNWS